MMKILLRSAICLFLVVPLQAGSIPSPKDLPQGYLESLYQMMLKAVKEDNFAGAKVLAAEIETVSETNFTSSNIAPCGAWVWIGGAAITVLYPGGKAFNGETPGVWKWTDEAKRQFQIDWGGVWLDQVIISEDSMTLHCRNNEGTRWDARRILIPTPKPDPGKD